MTQFIRKHSTTRTTQKRSFYKLVVARSDVTAALTACRLFMKTVDGLGHELYYPLYCSIVTCYARPFTDNKTTGPLSSHWRKFQNRRLQETHNDLIVARNELIAHGDLKVRKVKIMPSGSKLGKTDIVSHGLGLEISSYYFPLSKFQSIHDTCLDLGQRLNDKINEELEKLYGGMELPSKPFELRFDDGL